MSGKFSYQIVCSVMAGLLALAAGSLALAHHPVLGKFDSTQRATLEGRVTAVDWRNPHAHIFINVQGSEGIENWAVELESPIFLKSNGWSEETVQPGDAITVDGPIARDGSRQIWGDEIQLTDVQRKVFNVSLQNPPKPLNTRPAPRWPDGQPALGATPEVENGYWSFPSETVLVEDGVDVDFTASGQLLEIENADRVAPMQPWALELFKHRQQRQLRDDPMYLNCKPPGGPRQYQSPLGIQLIEDRQRERIFVLIGSGNRNYRIIYLDGRDFSGQVTGDDDNPLFYGRSVGEWEGDTLVVRTTGFNEDFWFSNGGLPHTSMLELEERFTRPDLDTLHYQVTVNDPGAYTRPWTASWTLQWVGAEELPVHFCQHNRQ